MAVKNFRSLVEWEIDSRKLEEVIKLSCLDQNLGDIVNKTGVYVGMQEYKVIMGVAYNLEVE